MNAELERMKAEWCDIAEDLDDVVTPRLEDGCPEPCVEDAAARYIDALLDGNCEPTEPERQYVERLRALDDQIEASGGWKPEAPPWRRPPGHRAARPRTSRYRLSLVGPVRAVKRAAGRGSPWQ